MNDTDNSEGELRKQRDQIVADLGYLLARWWLEQIGRSADPDNRTNASGSARNKKHDLPIQRRSASIWNGRKS